MAHVHVHVAGEQPKPGPLRRTVRWADRALLGMVMGLAAYAVERAVLRAGKRAAPADATG